MNNPEYVYHYANFNVIKSIQNQVKFREMCFINPIKDCDRTKNPAIRHISANTCDLVLRNMKSFKFIERQYNIYYSLARFDFARMNKELGIPPFSFKWGIRSKQKELFDINYAKYIVNYDFCIDFDFNESLGFEHLYNDVKLIKNQFDIRQIPYALIFSGRGFYMIVPGKYFWTKIEKPFEIIVKFVKSLKQILAVSSIDENIYDLRRVVKCYDTLDIRSGNICVPLKDEDFIMFDKKNKRPSELYVRDYQDSSYLRQGNELAFIQYMKEILSLNYEVD